MKNDTPQSELLTTILNDYKKTTGEEHHAVVEKFCEYAANWLHNKKPIGLGHSFGDGLSLRFADTKELAIIAVDGPGLFVPPSVSITGSSGGSVRQASGAVIDSSLGITVSNER